MDGKLYFREKEVLGSLSGALPTFGRYKEKGMIRFTPSNENGDPIPELSVGTIPIDWDPLVPVTSSSSGDRIADSEGTIRFYFNKYEYGELIEGREVDYDQEGRKTNDVKIEGSLILASSYIYDDDGNLSYRIDTTVGGGEDTQITSSEIETKEGNKIETVRRETANDDGLFVPTSEAIIERDKDGNEIGRAEFGIETDENGDEKITSVKRTQITTDAKGNKIKTESQLTPGTEALIGQRIIDSTRGLLLEVTRSTAEGSITETYEYDSPQSDEPTAITRKTVNTKTKEEKVEPVNPESGKPFKPFRDPETGKPMIDPETGQPMFIDPETSKPIVIDPQTGKRKPITIDPDTGKPKKNEDQAPDLMGAGGGGSTSQASSRSGGGESIEVYCVTLGTKASTKGPPSSTVPSA